MTGAEIAIIAGTGLAAYSSYQQGVDARDQARSQAAWAEYNSKVSRQQAEYERKAAQEQAEAHRRKAQILLSSMRAKTGRSGVAMSGSPLLLYEDTANQLEKERANILEAGENRSRYYQNQSILDLSQAKAYRKQGRAAYRQGIIGAAAEGVGGYADYKYKKSLLNNDVALAKKHGIY
jgi:hypothetical protein